MTPFVLVVDDDLAIRESLTALLEDEGHRVRCAANGQEALAVLQQQDDGRAFVILLDLMMPVMDGVEFRARQLAEPALADIPVVLITASGPQIARSVPAQAVLHKPLRAEALLKTVARFCPTDASLPGV